MNDIAFARALHVLAVVVWIGGAFMATAVVLPAIRRGELGPAPFKALHAIEHRFIWYARSAAVLVAVTGLYMTWRMQLWERFRLAAFWWMHAMVAVWLLFAFALFIAEPFIVRRRFGRLAQEKPEQALRLIHRAHWVLMTLSAVTIFAAVAGSWGGGPF